MGMGFGRMSFQPGQLQQTKVTKGFLVRILKYILPYWKYMLVVGAAIFASSLLGLVPPVMIKNIVDHALPSKDLRLLGTFILISFSATVINGFIGVGENYLDTWISTRIVYDIRNQMYKHMENMSLRFFSTVKPGDIITRMTSDIGGVQQIFRSTLVEIVRNILILITTVGALFTMNYKLALLGIVVVPLFILPARKVGKVRWQIASQAQAKSAEMNQVIQETLSISGSTLMKIFTREQEEYKKFTEINREVVKLQIKESVAGRWFGMVRNVITTMGPMLIYFYGGYLFIHGEISVGAIIAFVALLNRMYGPVAQLSNIYIDVTRSLALFERIFEYLDKEHEIKDLPGAGPLKDVSGKVEFRNVGFSYNEQQETLKEINVTIEQGQMAAIVGHSGAGKSTLTNLIPRLYDATAGSVEIDGQDVRSVAQESLRSQIGIVMQDTYLFNASIKENLLYAKPDATDKEIINACKAAYIHDFILTLPEGYDTLVGNRGVKLSGGEKQRISIARVILKDPKIIILDEATSALDSVSEAYIQEAIGSLLKGRTSFVIAHRLSTIISADRILVMEDGRIVEMGIHEELIAKDGIYRHLYDTQFKHESAGE